MHSDWLDPTHLRPSNHMQSHTHRDNQSKEGVSHGLIRVKVTAETAVIESMAKSHTK